MNRTISKILLLMLITSIGITNVEAVIQQVTIDVVPDNAGTVQVWKIINYGTNNMFPTFIGSTKTIATYNLDTKDSTNVNNGNTVVSIMPLNDNPSPYMYVKQCDHVECITGNYYGELYQDLTTYKISVYYEIPTDKIPPVITGIALSNKNPYVGDYINVMVSATDNVGVTKVMVDDVILTDNGNSWSGKIQALYTGYHTLSVNAWDAVGNNVLDGSKGYTLRHRVVDTGQVRRVHRYAVIEGGFTLCLCLIVPGVLD